MAAAALILPALTVLRPPATPGGDARDFQAYLAAGHAYARGANPYSAQIVRDEPALDPRSGAMLPFVGTPASLPFWSLLSKLPAAWALMLWNALLVASLVILAAASARLALTTAAFDTICALLVAAAFAPADGAIALGQTAIVAAAAAALAAAGSSQIAAGTGAFAAFVLQPNVALASLALFCRRGSAMALSIALCACIVISLAAVGAGGSFAYVPILAAHAHAEAGSILQLTPAAVATSFGASPSVAVGIALFAGLGAAFAALWVAARVRRTGAVFAALCCALPLGATFFHVQDLAIVLVPAIVTLRRAPARWFGPALVGTVATGTNWLDLAQTPAAFPQDLALSLALIVAACAMRPRLDRSALVYAAAALLLVACGAWLATNDPLPVWPDALRPFHAGAGLSAATRWHLELEHAGLLTPNVGSALLRTIPLAGCALLLFIVGRSCVPDQMSTFMIESNGETPLGSNPLRSLL
jgi:hypothetical protein